MKEHDYVDSFHASDSALVQAGSRPRAGDGKMTAEERAKAIKMLHDSQNELMGLHREAQRRAMERQARPFKWTVGETAEHIALAEGLAVRRNGTSARAHRSIPIGKPKTAGKDAILDNLLAARRGKANAPEPIQPLKRKMTRAEIMTLLKEGRAKSLKFIETTDLPLKAHTFDHPFPVFGTLNAYQWFVYIPAHNLRHNKQIAEIMNNPSFPNSHKWPNNSKSRSTNIKA